jgi:hypothetical protein
MIDQSTDEAPNPNNNDEGPHPPNQRQQQKENPKNTKHTSLMRLLRLGCWTCGTCAACGRGCGRGFGYEGVVQDITTGFPSAPPHHSHVGLISVGLVSEVGKVSQETRNSRRKDCRAKEGINQTTKLAAKNSKEKTSKRSSSFRICLPRHSSTFIGRGGVCGMA